MAAPTGGQSGLDRWITSGEKSAISEQIVRLTDKAKNSAFGEAVVASGRAEWDLMIEMESFGGISIGIFRQDLKHRDNINSLPTDEFFTYSPEFSPSSISLQSTRSLSMTHCVSAENDLFKMSMTTTSPPSAAMATRTKRVPLRQTKSARNMVFGTATATKSRCGWT